MSQHSTLFGGGQMSNAQEREAFFEILKDACQPFHSPDGTTYARVSIKGYQEVVAIKGKKFRHYAALLYREFSGKIPVSNFLKDIISMIDAEASIGPERPVYIRVAEIEGAIYIDLCNERREQVRITSAGWEIIDSAQSPACFIRSKRSSALVIPQKGGSLQELRRFFNLESEGHFILLVAFLVGALHPNKPRPHLSVQGEQGTGKSMACRLGADLIDPKCPSFTNLPSSERDVAIAATNSWLQSHDNASTITDPISDVICKLVSGGGFVTRALYTDGGEAVFNFQRPIITNGITGFVQRPDLCDRTIFIRTVPIPAGERRPEFILQAEWEAVRPRVLGALYDAVSCALKNLHTTKIDACPRMADFVHWVVAAEEALPWAPGEFLAQYEQNRLSAIDDAIEADPIASAVMKLVQTEGNWSGTATELMQRLTLISPEEVKCSTRWPKQANTLSSKLKRCMTFLRERSVEIEFSKSGQRIITITSAFQKPVFAAAMNPVLLPDPMVQQAMAQVLMS